MQVSEYQRLPMVECPACKKESQWDDYYELDTGSQRECPKCDEVLVVTDHYIGINVAASGKKSIDLDWRMLSEDQIEEIIDKVNSL